MKETYRKHLASAVIERKAKNPSATGCAAVTSDGKTFELKDGAVLIAAIHELHQHLEPGRVDRRGPAGAQCAQAWAPVEALGQDEPRARLARGHGLSAEGRPAQ
jgi:hypothetical protein